MSMPSLPDEDRAKRREAAMQFLAGRIDYERAQSMPCSEEALKLDRMRELLRRMGSPQDEMPIIHVAGTKGKGSTSAMLAAVLLAAGYRTGLFTSPHIERVEERIAIDGQPCSADEFAELIERARPHIEAIDQSPNPQIPKSPNPTPSPLGPTYFEILTAMALDHFRRRGVNAAVLEVGLGGRLDSTNVCLPCVSIITSISFDHTKQLGETLAAIAAEKGGIIKPGVPVISGVDLAEPRDTIRRIARQNGSRLVELGVDFDFQYHPPRHLEREPSPALFDLRSCPETQECSRTDDNDQNSRGPTARGDTTDAHRGPLAPSYWADVALGLIGRHQAANAAIALATIEELRQQGWTVPDEAIRRGLADINWPARVEVVGRHPTVVLDAAHNVASIAALVEVLDESFSANRHLLIFATTQEKDHRGMLQQFLGRFDHIIFTRYSNNPRSVPPEELLALAEELQSISPFPLAEGPQIISPHALSDGPGLKAAKLEIVPTPSEAWAAVRHTATPDDLICITGSFFLASEMRAQIAARPI
jgi:dihydrofolate synthase / folylpolyglutamate synthase